MTNAELIHHEISDQGFTHKIAMRTQRGIYVGTCNHNDVIVEFWNDNRRNNTIRAIDRWVIVPRWMTPLQALNVLLP